MGSVRQELIVMHNRLKREQERVKKLFPNTDRDAALPCDEIVRNLDTTVAQIELAFQYTDETLQRWASGIRR